MKTIYGAGMKNKVIDKRNKKTPLKWSMILLLIFCWILPLTLSAYLMLYVTTSKVSKQIERTIVTSADNAIKLCEMQMSAAIMASRNASYFPMIKDSYQQYKRDGNEAALYSSVTKFLEQHFRYNDHFLHTAVIFTDEPDRSYYTSYSGSTNYTSYRANMRLMNDVKPIIMSIYENLDTDIKFLNVDNKIYMVRNMMDSTYHPYAVIAIQLDTDMFAGLQSTWGYVDSEIYIGGELLIGDSGDGLNVDVRLFEPNSRKAKLTQIDGEYYAYAVRKPGSHLITYVMELDKQLIINETEAIKYVGLLFILFMIPLVVIIFVFFHRKISRPVSKLIKVSHEIEEGRFGYQIEGVGNSQEFQYLIQAFNSMSEKLKYQFETIYLEELALKDARIMALQSQINPHFLNNTLEIINWEARISGNYKVSNMIENLSIMLEATMDRRHRRFVTLAEEMSYVEAYLFIIAQRLGERMHVEKKVDKKLLNTKVPRLIIQPIIENAVEHGIIGQPSALITLNVFADGDKLIIEVINSGAMSEEDEQKIEVLLKDDYEPGEFGSASLGVRNVNRRIKIIYGEECGLTVKNNEKNETVSSIMIKIDMTTIKDKK